MLVTGGARGIGRAVALDLGRRGWRVTVGYRQSGDEAAAVVEAIARDGGEAVALRGDVADAEQAAQLVRDSCTRFGRIDALVHAAGPYRRTPLLEETLEGWHSMFDANLHATYYLCRELAPLLQRQGWGRIVTFGVVNAERAAAQPNITAYAIAKLGVVVLTRTLAKLLAADGVTVNCISPGFIDTASPDKGTEQLASAIKRIPAGRVGTPDDLIGAVRFLLSDEASYITGANLTVSGGWGL